MANARQTNVPRAQSDSINGDKAKSGPRLQLESENRTAKVCKGHERFTGFSNPRSIHYPVDAKIVTKTKHEPMQKCNAFFSNV
eukprot:1612937-Amphidinium_carterae.2